MAVLKNGGKSGVDSLIEFLMENHKDISFAQRITGTIAEYIVSEAMSQSYSALLKELGHLFTEEELQKFMLTVHTNLDWVHTNEEDIRQFLIDYSNLEMR